MASLEPEHLGQLFTVALTLSQSLERELRHLEGKRSASRMKEVYDAVYLPRLVAVSHGANRYVESQDWQLLRQPLHPDLADSQIRIVVEMLQRLVMGLSPPRY
jgi:hypothetical protein